MIQRDESVAAPYRTRLEELEEKASPEMLDLAENMRVRLHRLGHCEIAQRRALLLDLAVNVCGPRLLAQSQPDARGGEGAWSCAARKQSLPEPVDCGWPTCGCDPYADKVISALEESGALAAPPTPAPVSGAELREAAAIFRRLEKSIMTDLRTAHDRGPGASSAMREDDRDMIADLRTAFGLLALADRPGTAAGAQG